MKKISEICLRNIHSNMFDWYHGYIYCKSKYPKESKSEEICQRKLIRKSVRMRTPKFFEGYASYKEPCK